MDVGEFSRMSDVTGDNVAETSMSGVKVDVGGVIAKVAKHSGDAWSAPSVTAEKWLAGRKTAVGYTGKLEEFRIALCYHLLKNTCSEEVDKDVVVWMPDGSFFVHERLTEKLGKFALRQMATTLFRKTIPEVINEDEVKNILAARAAAAGLDSSNARLSIDFLHPADMTPAEIALRGATKRIVIDERNRQKIESIKVAAAKASVGQKSEPLQRNVIADSGWQG